MTSIPDKLLSLMNATMPLEQSVLEAIEMHLLHKTIRKKEWLLQPGETSKYLYFVEKGLLRSYYYDTTHEITNWFMREGELVIAVESFYQQKPANEYIQAIEDCELYYISYQSLMALYNQYHGFCLIGCALTQLYYVKAEERMKNVRKKQVIERYRFLLEYHPQIIQRSPLTYIASYLGITLETLSRLRAKRI